MTSKIVVPSKYIRGLELNIWIWHTLPRWSEVDWQPFASINMRPAAALWPLPHTHTAGWCAFCRVVRRSSSHIRHSYNLIKSYPRREILWCAIPICTRIMPAAAAAAAEAHFHKYYMHARHAQHSTTTAAASRLLLLFISQRIAGG